jgi:hypothetical protein
MKKLFWHLFLSYLAMLSLAILFLWLIYSINLNTKQAFNNNVAATLQTLESEGTYPTYGFYPRKIVLDNFTDALMLNTAYTAQGTNLKPMLLNQRYMAQDNKMDQIQGLKAAYNQTKNSSKTSYERYWHGYLIFLKPLLAIISYQKIRLLLGLILYSSLVCLLYLLLKRHKYCNVVAILLAALAVDFFYLNQSLQFSQVFLIGIIGSIISLIIQGKKQKIPLIFFIIGMLTSFFDLLTAPLVTLGFLIISTHEEENILKVLKNSFFWGLGYTIFWVSKWLLVEIFLKTGAIRDALGHVLNRTVNPADQNFSQIKAIILNVNQMIGYEKMSRIIWLAAVLASIIILVIFRRKKIQIKKTSYWILIALIPYAWYLITANHSYLHVWFTYRAQFISVAAAFLAYKQLVDWQKLNAWLRKITTKSSNSR